MNRKSTNTQQAGVTKANDGHRWVPPETGQLKLNVDASIVEGQSTFAVGMILRNHYDQYIAGRTMRFVGSVSVLEAEIIGITEALLWSQQVTDGMVSVESDSLLGVTTINRSQLNFLELGDLI